MSAAYKEPSETVLHLTIIHDVSQHRRDGRAQRLVRGSRRIEARVVCDGHTTHAFELDVPLEQWRLMGEKKMLDVAREIVQRKSIGWDREAPLTHEGY